MSSAHGSKAEVRKRLFRPAGAAYGEGQQETGCGIRACSRRCRLRAAVFFLSSRSPHRALRGRPYRYQSPRDGSGLPAYADCSTVKLLPQPGQLGEVLLLERCNCVAEFEESVLNLPSCSKASITRVSAAMSAFVEITVRSVWRATFAPVYAAAIVLASIRGRPSTLQPRRSVSSAAGVSTFVSNLP
jgi:hypothetical protein